MLRFRTCFLRPTDFQFDWDESVYDNVHEDILEDIPAPLGNIVTLSHYVDANLYHDMTLGCFVTGILHLVNQTLVEWCPKKQATVETATYGSESVSARTFIGQVIDLHLTLHYLDVPIQVKSYVFGEQDCGGKWYKTLF